MLWREQYYAVIRYLFGPVVTIGNKDRARRPGELDDDAKRLGDLNRTWREMLREDEWMVKLMTHVRLLHLYIAFFFTIFLLLGLYLQLPAKHWAYMVPLSFIGLALPYWAWVGNWNRKIVTKVLEEFKKRFGKHFHLK